MKTTPDIKNIERQCFICHDWFLTAKGSWNVLCGKHQSKWNRFKFITYPTYRNKWLGIDLIDDLYSYYWLNITKRKQLWSDADDTDCPRKWCRYCGKGTVHNSHCNKEG